MVLAVVSTRVIDVHVYNMYNCNNTVISDFQNVDLMCIMYTCTCACTFSVDMYRRHYSCEKPKVSYGSSSNHSN